MRRIQFVKKIFTYFSVIPQQSTRDPMSIFDGSRLPLSCRCFIAIFQVEFSSYFCFPFVSSFRYRDPCSLSLNEDDNHTITLVGNANKRAVTLAKTCEQVNELRDCRAPRDWSILALQNTRTGKSHYLVICKCPSHFRLGELSPRCFGASLTGPINIGNRETISLL